jgi:raffinose/stachyose/melibiose transport system permease protein
MTTAINSKLKLSPKPARGKGLKSRLGQSDFVGYFYVVPAGIFFVSFVLFPLFQTFNLSLYEWSGIIGAPVTFVGLGNYFEILSEPNTLRALSHTVVFIFTFSVIPVSLGLIFAALFSRQQITGLSFFRTVIFLPQVIASVVIGVAFRWVYSDRGTLNQVLGIFGSSENRAWLGDFDWALLAVGLIGSWALTGLCMVLFLSGVGRIDSDLYDAVKIDGGGAIREFFTVTLPGLRPELTVAATITVIAALRSFDLVFVTTKGGPGKETIVPGTEIYRLAFRESALGEAASMAILLAFIIFGLVRLIAFVLRDRDGVAK